MGRHYRGTERYNEAEQAYQQALMLQKRLTGEEHGDFATTLNNLAGNCRLQGKYEEAEVLFRHCLELYEKTVGKETTLYDSAWNNLALLYQSVMRMLFVAI